MRLLPLSPLLKLCRREIASRSWVGQRRCYTIVSDRTYEDAIELLNTLQTPYEELKRRRDAGIRIDITANDEMRECLARIGYNQNDLEKLNIVHIAGTKGKGSTCAYVDSILANYIKSHDFPRKIGLFTSPHLIAVRERIRINSSPISAALFAKCFFEVWDSLSTSPSLSKPVYFRYLTLLSYHVFLSEGVDTAIYEVGVGGEYDSTNIVDKPAVTGISTLGIDHTFALGETIDRIAWHKAGIQKRDVPSFTVRQIPAALEVIERRAEEKGVKSLGIVGLDSRLEGVKIRPNAPFQKGNASLAISLAETVLQKVDPSFVPSETLPREFVDGLEKVVWRGRCETKQDGNITWYLDGAHTADSIIVASKWFDDESSEMPGPKILIFNQQGHREAIELLEGLHNALTVRFDHVIFCPTVPIDSRARKDHISHATSQAEVATLSLQNAFAKKWTLLVGPESTTKVNVLPSVEDAFSYVRKVARHEDGVSVLVTGSVHLIGRALGSLEGVDAL